MSKSVMTLQQFRDQHKQRRAGGLSSNAKFRAKVSNGIISKEDFIASGLGNEAHLQKSCVSWFRLKHPNLLLFSSLNGVKLRGGGREWKRLEREGALAGVADLFLSAGSGDMNGLYIEMKTKRGKQSPAQIAFERKALAGGYGYAMPTSKDEFMRVVAQYLDNGMY